MQTGCSSSAGAHRGFLCPEVNFRVCIAYRQTCSIFCKILKEVLFPETALTQLYCNVDAVFYVKWQLYFSILFGLMMMWPVSVHLLTRECIWICEKGVRDVLAGKLRCQVLHVTGA